MARLPALFVSHGAPNLVLHESPARTFLAEFTGRLERPKAIIMVSAHFEAERPTVVSDPHPEMIYDFRGFEPELYEMNYPAPGSRDLAERVAGAIGDSGLPVSVAPRRGYDHGVWVPLILMYPDADIPVVQVSVQHGASAADHYALGAALAGFRDEGVLIVGSGSFTHNLYEAMHNLRQGAVDAVRPEWVVAFVDWMARHIEAGDVADLLDYRARAPYAVENHPTDEHLMPLYVALGAGGEGARPEHIHGSSQFGVLQLDAYAFH
ncbi:class III extradiol ring-cleavage dioxygenase [Microbaculum marinum]|uniref:Class III extradiol ring-cleavage dioxygenase n=1 Tax=Microbaculum marinum TaxID=1764581 RepID=A0AAW9RXG3_9HYPH